MKERERERERERAIINETKEKEKKKERERGLTRGPALNMARAALIREGVSAYTFAGDTKAAGTLDRPDTGGQKCAQKIAANLNC